MAEQQQNPGLNTNSFFKGMTKDLNESFVPDGVWTHARNAVNNSYDGQSGVIGNEPANLHCVDLPYTLIGCVHISDDQWALFTTDDTNSEIGIFDESECRYTKVINDACLNFKRSNLITGVFRRRFDCERLVYFDDGLNPTRFIDVDNPPLKTEKSIVNSCVVEKVLDPPQLDCEKLRIIPFVKHPCINLKKGAGAGNLLNGSYQVSIAYTINKVRITDYIGLTEVQSLFVHGNLGSSLEVEILDIDKSFEEFELVVLAQINSATIAKRVGYYSTNQSTIYIDYLPNELVTVSISDLVLRREPIEKSDALYSVNNYILRVGSYSKTKFNYQPVANKIKTNWVAVEYPADYYTKKGNNTGYMRDEQYAFFIRWIYNTGEFSESYHIPGREAKSEELRIVSGDDAFEAYEGQAVKHWQVYNTATVDNRTSYSLPDGGTVIAKGKMGYWESTEKYPDNKSLIWGDLCGKPIRHHKFPDETCDVGTVSGNRVLDITKNSGNSIVLLGVEFSNIEFPVDINGDPISSIVGYEILRGSREGHKTILGKGIFNNMREYDIPKPKNSKLPTQKGLYQNFPFNDLREDYYHTTNKSLITKGGDNNLTAPLKNYRKDIFSFHSPDTSFSNPFLNPSEVKFYQDVYGEVKGSFEECYKHPKVKLLNNKAGSIAAKLAIAIAVSTALGKGNLTTGDDPKAPAKADVAGGKINSPGVGGAAGTEFITTAINVALIVASAAIDVGIMIGTSFMISDTVLRLMNKLAKLNQHALQYNSYGFYNQSKPKQINNIRRKAKEAIYVGGDSINFGADTVIANRLRPKFVAVKLDKSINNPSVEDTTRVLVNDSITPKALYEEFTTTASSHYGALKIKLAAQYGQIDTIKQIPIGSCVTAVQPGNKNTSSVLFGGDVYITRFSEKNSMLFFNTWMLGEPDETEFDYRNYMTVPYTRFWMDSTQENYQDLDIKIKLQSPISVKKAKVKLQDPVKVTTTLAQNKRSLNRLGNDGKIEIRNAYFYLFNNGVRDFFVESEINLAYRDWEDLPAKRHYAPGEFTDLSLMFRSDLVKESNYYKYDYSLSVSKLFNAQISWGTVLSRDFDPAKAVSCFTYYPNRVFYSLPQQDGSKKDNWRVYLPNNYKDFISPVSSIKSIAKTGAMFMMARQSPLMFMGVETLQLDGGAKITIGDGALFSGPQQLQAVVNSDTSYEYGSCQNRYSTLSCTHGVFWVSQDQGKIFQYAGGLNEISRDNMKWWFAKYLPSELLKIYPTYPLYDNPVLGIGVQAIYDNTNEIIYFTKKDYRPVFTDLLLDGHLFYKYVNGVKTYYSFDSEAFEDASWTISYDPKSKVWVSFHDWKPTMLIPGKAHFMSVNMDSIWKHNSRCDKYCNFYGVDHPFEVEFVSSTGQSVTTVRNIEYILEAYKTYNNCRDKFHLLDENFDQAMIYNSEQISGLLELKMKDKGNPTSLLNFPQINTGSIKIQCSKEENKYRFNQFWDVTNDRGEFTHKEIPMFNTRPNGYQFDINARYVNYKKSALERKKFRHMINRVLLRKVASNDVKMLFKISNQKIVLSPR